MTEADYIKGIRQGDMRIFEHFFNHYEKQFKAFARHTLKVYDSELRDYIYKMSCAIVLNNIRAGKCHEDNLSKGSLKTYLFNVGRLTLMNEIGKQSVPLVFEHEIKNDENFLDHQEGSVNPNKDKYDIIRECVNLMQSPCSELLNRKVFYDEPNSKIAADLGYKEEHSVSVQVNKCKAKLIAFTKKRLVLYGY